jgi:thiamine-phosphate pyrophosphorylase
MKISKLHYISQQLEGKSHSQLIEEACAAGANWVQLRMKGKSYEEALNIAHEAKEICQKYKAVFIINDHVAIAKEVKADGVHLGKLDMSPAIAREILGVDYIIGGTSNTMEDIRILKEAKVDYIGLGPLRFTSTKENLSPILGLEGYQKLLKQCNEENISIPVIAIGGITMGDIPELLKAGLHGVAISSLINKADGKKGLITLLKEALQESNIPIA